MPFWKLIVVESTFFEKLQLPVVPVQQSLLPRVVQQPLVRPPPLKAQARVLLPHHLLHQLHKVPLLQEVLQLQRLEVPVLLQRRRVHHPQQLYLRPQLQLWLRQPLLRLLSQPALVLQRQVALLVLLNPHQQVQLKAHQPAVPRPVVRLQSLRRLQPRPRNRLVRVVLLRVLQPAQRKVPQPQLLSLPPLVVPQHLHQPVPLKVSAPPVARVRLNLPVPVLQLRAHQ